jgi:hypothetical protein
MRYRARVIFLVKGPRLSEVAMYVRHLTQLVSGVTRGSWFER